MEESSNAPPGNENVLDEFRREWKQEVAVRYSKPGGWSLTLSSAVWSVFCGAICPKEAEINMHLHS